MSLRLRLLISIAFVLLFTLLFASALIYLNALTKVNTEMRAALAVGARTVQNATDDPEEAVDPFRQLELLVEDFNGNRHVRAFLMNNEGIAVDKSTLLMPDNPAPEWFNALLAREPEFVHIFLPPAFARYGSIILTTDSHNEIDEVWIDFLVTLAVLAFFCTLVLALIFITLGAPLRLLRNMSTAFKRVGNGDYSPRIAETGARELTDLTRCFNEMVTRLSAIEHLNQALEAQLATVQEEERVDLARDLHDEIGPLLFALNIDISTLRSQDWRRSAEKITAQLDAMSSAIAGIQQHVRSMLGKLRPAVLLDVGLTHAVDNLVSFWGKRHNVRITVELERASFGEKLDATIYRILQEALNNALRHGNPSLIEIHAREDGLGFVMLEVRDNGSGLATSCGSFGFGLTGMKERVESLGGSLFVGNRVDVDGVSVRATLPLSSPEDAFVREAVE